MTRRKGTKPPPADASPSRPKSSSSDVKRLGLQSAERRRTPLKVKGPLSYPLGPPDRSEPPADLSHSEYGDLFDFAPVTCAVIDAIGLIVRISAAASRLLNVDRPSLIGLPLASFIVPEDRRAWIDHLRRCREQTTVVESEIRFVSRHASRVTCRVLSQRTWHQGQQLYPTVIADQTELRALDEARLAAERRKELAERDAAIAIAASEGKDRLIAAVSHELRTPLAPALIAAGRLARWEELPDTARQLAATIKRNIELQARLIDDLLDIARMREGRLELALETVDIHQLLIETIRICSPLADSKAVIVTPSFTAGARFVNADPSRLRQVFWNLLNNAVKFSGNNGQVVVTTANHSATTIAVAVRDDGLGMSSSTLAQLFTPFQRSSRKDSRTGLGLGLTICKGIVDAHDGRIWGASEGPGRGSTFILELATASADHTALVPDFSANTVHNRSDLEAAHPLRILLVEDDADNREILASSLSDRGYHVELASSLVDGLRKLDQEWDVVMSDIRLPDGSGLDIARRAHRLPRPPRQLVALTGFGSDSDLKASRDAGFDIHLVKPIDLERLVTMFGLLGSGRPH